jgi:hypothetical protein
MNFHQELALHPKEIKNHLGMMGLTWCKENRKAVTYQFLD